MTARARLIHGDCLAALEAMPTDSVDAVVTDPPYDLTTGKKGGTGQASVNLDSPYGRSRIGTGNGAGGFMGMHWDSTGVAFDPAFWVEVLRVLKPGGHLLAFGGSRTSHRLTSAVEDAGFEIRDSIAWLYGSGFPKSLDVSKAIDKAAGAEREVTGPRVTGAGHIQNRQNGTNAFGTFKIAQDGIDMETAPATDAAQQWAGWGTALKPGYEPIVVARKPFRGTVAANVQEYGTGALNIDGCRVPTTDRWSATGVQSATGTSYVGSADGSLNVSVSSTHAAGRWPTNVVMDESQAAELDAQSGITPGGHHPATRGGIGYGSGAKGTTGTPRTMDSGGASRFFPVFKYQAKAPAKERPKDAEGKGHPTVKPLELMRWLVRLVTPPDGLVVDPFAGSGTTGEACLLEGFRCILIEREADYMPLIAARLERVE